MPSIENEGENDYEVKSDQEKELDKKIISSTSVEKSRVTETKINCNNKILNLENKLIKSYLHKKDEIDGNVVVSAFKQPETVLESPGYLPMDGSANVNLVSIFYIYSDYIEKLLNLNYFLNN